MWQGLIHNMRFDSSFPVIRLLQLPQVWFDDGMMIVITLKTTW